MEFFSNNIVPGEVFVQLFAFLIVFGVLRMLAWGPIQKALADRREKIKTDLEQIEATKSEIERLKEEYTASLQKIDEEARNKLQEALEEGRQVARDIQEKAKEEAKTTFEQSKQKLELEVEKARLGMKAEVADLVVQVTEKVLAEKLTEDKQQEKILSFIDELDASLQTKGDS